MAKKQSDKKRVNIEAPEVEVSLEAEVQTADLTDEMSLNDSQGGDSADLESSEELLTYSSDEEAPFLQEPAAENLDFVEDTEASTAKLEGTELENFESAAIEDVEFIEEERLSSILESILFASDRPVSFAALKMVFKGTNIKNEHLRRALQQMSVSFAGGDRGVALHEVPGGYQLRTKLDNMEFIRRNTKARTFRLSGPALEVLSIVAYKQPVIKFEIDEIRGVESGHLLRALMERGLVNFEGKSDKPGRPMQYGTTKKFLEIFGLRNLKELPTLHQIDELLPEGIGDEENPSEKKSHLSDLTEGLSEHVGNTYSEGEEELQKIQDQLQEITTTSDFFEDEKRRQREKRDFEKAQNIREALTLGESVSNRDQSWLKRYDEAIAQGKTLASEEQSSVVAAAETNKQSSVEDSLEETEASLFEEESEHGEDELPLIASDEELEGAET